MLHRGKTIRDHWPTEKQQPVFPEILEEASRAGKHKPKERGQRRAF